MLKFTTTLKEFEKENDWAWVQLDAVPSQTYMVTTVGDVFKVVDPHNDHLKLAKLESKGMPNHANMYITTLRALDGTQLRVPTAKLVANAFVEGKSDERNEIIYLDQNRENVNAWNLRWATHRELLNYYIAERRNKLNDAEQYVKQHQLTAQIEEAMRNNDRLEAMHQEPKPSDDAEWDDELGWVIYSHVRADDNSRAVAESNYEIDEKQARREEREANKQVRMGYGTGTYWN